MSEDSIKNVNKSESNFAPTFVGHHLLPDITFNGPCLMENSISILKNIVMPYISYILISRFRNLNTYFTLNNCLFGSARKTKNADPDKYYNIEFDFSLEFLFMDASMGRNAIIFRVYISSSAHVDNKAKDNLILDEAPTQG